MSGPMAGDLVRPFLLRFGHRLPSPWSAPEALAILTALSAELACVGGEQIAVCAYEAALDSLAHAGLVDYETIGTVGPLLELFCDFLVSRGVLPNNPHRLDQVICVGQQSTPQAMTTQSAVLPAEPVGANLQPEHTLPPSPAASTDAAPETNDWATLRRLIEEFFFERETGATRLADKSASAFRGDFKVALSYLEPNHPRLTGESLRAYVRWLEKEAPNPRGGTYSLATAARKKTALSSLLSWANNRGHWPEIDHHVILKTKKRDKVARDPYRALSPQDDARYADAARKLPPAARIMAMLGRQCGLRAADAGKLGWVEVDFANRRLDYLCGKTGKRIAVPLDDETYNLLHEYRDSCPGETHLFSKAKGKLASGKDVLAVVKSVAVAARLSVAVTPHDLRKTFATIKYYRENADLLDIQRWLGHEDLNTTREYIDPYAGWHRKGPGAAAA